VTPNEVRPCHIKIIIGTTSIFGVRKVKLPVKDLKKGIKKVEHVDLLKFLLNF
jgi:hypothetical protein